MNDDPNALCLTCHCGWCHLYKHLKIRRLPRRYSVERAIRRAKDKRGRW